ncbi:MAG: hypothetical protein R6W48_04985 [Gaiellaceae bacterium]
MARYGSQELVSELDGAAHRVARRNANRQIATAAGTKTDAQGLVEFGCECTKGDCERAVKVPLYVYRRVLDSGDQYLLQAGHHAFDQYRTIVSIGLTRIEEKA